MSKKFLSILLVALTVFTVIIPRVLSSTTDICSYHSAAYQGLEIEQLSQELTSTGLIGRIHGAAANAQMYVMCVREPKNFFSHLPILKIYKQKL